MSLLRLGYKEFHLSCFFSLFFFFYFSSLSLSLSDPSIWVKLCHEHPYREELRPPAKSHMSELGNGTSSPRQAFRPWGPSQQLDSNLMRDPEPDHQLSHSQVPDCQRLCEINIYYFKLLSLGIIYFTVIVGELHMSSDFSTSLQKLLVFAP